MARPIRVIPTLDGVDAIAFLKKADAAEKRYQERQKSGKLKDLTQDPDYIAMQKILRNYSTRQ